MTALTDDIHIGGVGKLSLICQLEENVLNIALDMPVSKDYQRIFLENNDLMIIYGTRTLTLSNKFCMLKCSVEVIERLKNYSTPRYLICGNIREVTMNSKAHIDDFTAQSLNSQFDNWMTYQKDANTDTSNESEVNETRR
ncbi:hypothetical protein GJ496_009733 [Pomphorhynchus laevis]|nr:hypothetical protein GJ496_009733 [Pomphorhynchus laevis]